MGLIKPEDTIPIGLAPSQPGAEQVLSPGTRQCSHRPQHWKRRGLPVSAQTA